MSLTSVFLGPVSVYLILDFAFWPTVAMVLTLYLGVLTHHFTESLLPLCWYLGPFNSFKGRDLQHVYVVYIPTPRL